MENSDEMDKVVYVLVKCPFEILLKIAEKLNYKMRIGENDKTAETTSSCWTRIFHANLDFKYPNKEKNDKQMYTALYKEAKREK